MKKYLTLISLGFVNVVHSILHLVQFLQSWLLIQQSSEDQHQLSWLEELSHNSYINIVWMAIGIYTLYLGITDFQHHRKCSHKNN